MLAHVTLGSAERLSLSLVSLSNNGCQLIVPFELRSKMAVYDQVTLEINEGGTTLLIDAELFRIAQDSYYSTIFQDLLVTLRFNQLSPDDEDELENMIADISLGTKQQQDLAVFRQIYNVD
jgi:hypothetical protein